MFRPMRRKNKGISIEESNKLLHETRRGVLAVNGDDGYPYAVPVNYFYDEAAQKIYFHGARVGHKAESIAKCDKICFTVWGNESIRKEPWAPFVQSVVVFGRCHVIQDEAVKLSMIKRFAMKYYPDEATVDHEIVKDGKAAQVYEIEIEHITGKEIQEI